MTGPANGGPAPPAMRLSRWRLIVPFLVLAVIAILVSGFWLYASSRSRAEVDIWLSREAAVGRNWSCGKRDIGGYPFRIELTCDGASFQGHAGGRQIAGSLGKVLAVAQVYTPKLLVIEATGPLQVVDNDGSRLDLAWSTLRASVRGEPGLGLERLSIESEAVSFRAQSPLWPVMSATAQDAQIHIRPTPNVPRQDHSYDFAMTMINAGGPGIAFVFGNDTINAEAQITVTQARPLSGRPPREELRRWHEAGGRVIMTGASAGIADRRIEGQGTLTLDEAHRLQGRIDLKVTGLDRLVHSVTGEKAGIGSLLGALTGARSKDPATIPATAPRPIALSLKLAEGRAMLGPFPLALLPPLY